jgi:signal transduction histidine kinase
VVTHARLRAEFDVGPRPRPMGIGMEVVARRKDGSELPVEISLTPLVSDDEPWVLATIVDISSRRAVAAQLERLTRGYRMLAHTNQAIVRAGSVDELHSDACRVVVEEGGYLAAWVGRLQQSGDVDMVASAGALDDYVGRLRVTTEGVEPQGQGPISVALRENRPVYGYDQSAPSGRLASASLPLRVHGKAVAVLTIYSERPDAFDEETRALLQGMAENASFGLAGFAAAAELDRSAVKSGELVRRLVRAQDDERSRIAADVHDDSVQSLAVVDLRLGLLLRRVQAEAPDLSEAVAELQATVGTVSAGLRLLLFELEPGDSEATLPELLREAAGVIFEGDPVRWTVEVDAPAGLEGVSQDPFWLPEPARTQVVRVVKEALRNVLKHSGADSVSVTVRPDRDGVEVSVLDDGTGIDPDRVRSAPGHRGLTTMRERVDIGGGWTQIDGGPTGTSLRFWMPRARVGEGHEELVLAHQ